MKGHGSSTVKKGLIPTDRRDAIYPWMEHQTLGCSISDDDFRPGGSGTGKESLQCLVRTAERLPVQTQSPATTQDRQQLCFLIHRSLTPLGQTRQGRQLPREPEKCSLLTSSPRDYQGWLRAGRGPDNQITRTGVNLCEVQHDASYTLFKMKTHVMTNREDPIIG